jgi:Zn-dependent protease
VDIRIDRSWLLIAALILLSLVAEFSRLAGRPSAGAVWIWAGATALLFFASILVHELSHSVVARSRGLGVEGITLFVFGGISQVRGEPRRPRDEVWIAGVGPLTSAALGGVFLLVARIFPEGLPSVATSWLGVVNLVLAIFNLLPGYPLDGGRLLRAGIWALTGNLRKATQIAASVGTVIGGALIAWGFYLLITTPAFLSGLWLGLIGWFLISAARRSVLHLELRDVLGRYTVAQVMNPECKRVPPDQNLQILVDDEVLGAGRRCFLVAEGDVLKGLLTLPQLKRLPREAWPRSTASEIMLPAERLLTVAHSEYLLLALQEQNSGEEGQKRLSQMKVTVET